MAEPRAKSFGRSFRLTALLYLVSMTVVGFAAMVAYLGFGVEAAFTATPPTVAALVLTMYLYDWYWSRRDRSKPFGDWAILVILLLAILTVLSFFLVCGIVAILLLLKFNLVDDAWSRFAISLVWGTGLIVLTWLSLIAFVIVMAISGGVRTTEQEFVEERNRKVG